MADHGSGSRKSGRQVHGTTTGTGHPSRARPARGGLRSVLLSTRRLASSSAHKERGTAIGVCFPHQVSPLRETNTKTQSRPCGNMRNQMLKGCCGRQGFPLLVDTMRSPLPNSSARAFKNTSMPQANTVRSYPRRYGCKPRPRRSRARGKSPCPSQRPDQCAETAEDHRSHQFAQGRWGHAVA